MMDPNRTRRDTRGPARPRFGRQRVPAAGGFHYDCEGRPTEQPPTANLRMLGLYFTDRAAYREWQRACIAWYEWRLSDRRNAIGLAPKMVIPVAAVTAFLLVFHWPADGDLSKLAARFGPGGMVDIARQVNSGPFCEGPSFKDGKCPGYEYGDRRPRDVSPHASAAPPASAGVFTGGSAPQDPPPAFGGWVGILMMVLVVIGLVRPKWLRWLFGVVRAEDRKPVKLPTPRAVTLPEQPKRPREDTYDNFDRRVQQRLSELDGPENIPSCHSPVRQQPLPAPVSGFGRKRF